jgi:hypothetical protein
MPRPVLFILLPVLLLALASTACEAQARQAQEAQNTPVLAPTGINVTSTPKAVRSATPNEAGTLAVMQLEATGRAVQADNTHTALTVTMQAKMDLYVIQTQAAQAPAQTATARYQSTANALAVLRITEQSSVWTATAAAPVVAATSAKLIEDAKNAPVRSFGEAWGLVIMDVLGFALVVLIGFALANNGHWFQHSAQVVEDDEPEPVREHWIPEQTGKDLISIPVEVATGKQLRMVADGLARGLSLSHGNFTPSGKGFSELEWRSFVEYCIDHRPPLMTERNPGLKNTAVDASDKLRAYLRNFETRPTPQQARRATDTPLLPVDRQTDTPTDTENGAGEGPTDPFGILPAADEPRKDEG